MADWREDEKKRLQGKIANETNKGPNGALFWKVNGAPVPADTFEDAGVKPPAAQAAALRAYYDKVAADYKTSRAKHGYSAEERFEMRAAFGPGATVVDIFTGKKFKT